MSRIIVDRRIMHGKPVIRGSRIPAGVVVGALAGGMSYEEVCSDYDIEVEDIRACLPYAAGILSEEQVFELSEVEEDV